MFLPLTLFAGGTIALGVASALGWHSLDSGGAGGGFVPALFYAPMLMGMPSSSEDPSRACMPFDVKRAGILTAEGSAARP